MGRVVSLAGYRARAPRRMRPVADETYLTKAALAHRWSVCERTLERWMRTGLPYSKPFEHGAVRFPLSLCESWFMERTGDHE